MLNHCIEEKESLLLPMYAMLANLPDKNERLRPAWTVWYRNPIFYPSSEEDCLSLV